VLEDEKEQREDPDACRRSSRDVLPFLVRHGSFGSVDDSRARDVVIAAYDMKLFRFRIRDELRPLAAFLAKLVLPRRALATLVGCVSDRDKLTEFRCEIGYGRDFHTTHS